MFVLEVRNSSGKTIDTFSEINFNNYLLKLTDD